MEQIKKQDTTTGNGQSTAAPILASDKDGTEAKLEQSPKRTSIAAGSTKPLSAREALSLIQTHCRDLRGMGFQVAILRAGTRIFIGIEPQASTAQIDFIGGNITLDGVPVSVPEVTK